jgi:Holliday junction resolvasome RuvABC endonuclease subunit
MQERECSSSNMAKKPAAKKVKQTTSFEGVQADVIVGLDMSLESPGWARYDCTNGAIESGFIDMKKMKLTGMERIRTLRKFVLEIVEIPKVKVAVFIEGYSFGSFGNSSISLGELGGVIRLTLSDKEIPYFEVPPTSLKLFVTGKGGSDKAVMLKELLKRWGHDINQNDEGDAVALIEIGKAALGLSKPTNAGQVKALEGLGVSALAEAA